MQTCIALRTMLVKDGIAYLQAGASRAKSCFFGEVLTIGQGGIVFDSDPYDEWMETINKLGTFSNISPPVRAIVD